MARLEDTKKKIAQVFANYQKRLATRHNVCNEDEDVE